MIEIFKRTVEIDLFFFIKQQQRKKERFFQPNNPLSVNLHNISD